MSCLSCPRHCADREKGFCGVGEKILVGRIAPHHWEEPVISGTRGSGTVFFSGCSLRCVFCQNRVISQELTGKAITAEVLDARLRELVAQGVHNINFVTPTHYALFLAQFLETHHYPVPIVYNCSGYESEEALEALRGKVQIFLPDFKYSDNALAMKYSAAPGYVETALKALSKMYALVGDIELDSDGLLKKGIIVRHLMLPANRENTLGVIDAFDSFSKGKKVLFSLMSQYIPMGNLSRFPELQRRLTPEEYDEALAYLQLSGIDGFAQDIDSAEAFYIPPFSDEL